MPLHPPEPATAAPASRASEPATSLEEEHGFDPTDSEPRPIRLPSRRRVVTVLGILAAVALLLILPPLISLSRYRRQVTASISASLGRPVHVGDITLTMLPIPGLTITDFYVSEDPAFGAEPVIYARSVLARLRMRSLWGRRLEFSRITFDEPSVNLVHRADGKWNLESILLSASRVTVAPTAQRGPGDAPRFPYIDATNARVNLKMGSRKMPLSLNEAKFSLWLPDRGQWHLRLEAHPARTNAATMDTGLIRLEGTLGKAGTLESVPLDLEASWTGAPLGAASWVLLGQDAGLRGDLTLNAAVQGTVGANRLTTRLQLAQVRRADFVPEQTLNADVRCTAATGNVFHTLSHLHCIWPNANPGPSPGSGLTLTADAPDVLQPATYAAQASLEDVPLSLLGDILHVASPRIARDVRATGSLSGQFTLQPGESLTGSLNVPQATLAFDQIPTNQLASPVAADLIATPNRMLVFKPLNLDLGGAATLDFVFSLERLQMHLTGTVLRRRLLALAQALPQFGEDLEPVLPPASTPELPIPVDLQSQRLWGAAQTWSAVASAKPSPTHRKHRRNN